MMNSSWSSSWSELPDGLWPIDGGCLPKRTIFLRFVLDGACLCCSRVQRSLCLFLPLMSALTLCFLVRRRFLRKCILRGSSVKRLSPSFASAVGGHVLTWSVLAAS